MRFFLFCCFGLLFLNAEGLAEKSLAPRLGFYQWVGVLPRGAEADLLTESRRRAVETGARVFRLYVGARFDYVHPVQSPRRFRSDGIDGPLTPAKIMTIPRYRAVLEDPAIDTVVLTVYPIDDYGGGPDDMNLLRPWGERERDVESEQIAELCRFLYREFGDRDKTVILANTEADDKMIEIMNYTGSPNLAVENLRRWTKTRFEAIAAARAAHQGARLQILHAFEISLVNLRIVQDGDLFRKASPEFGAFKKQSWNALDNVVPAVSFDLLSYSAYESTNSPYQTQQIDTEPSEAGRRLRRDLQLIRRRAADSVSREGRRRFGDEFVMVGEVGYARDRFEHLASGGILPRLRTAVRAALDWGCPYVVFWQVFDAPRNGRDAWGFGMYDRRGEIPKLQPLAGRCESVHECVVDWIEDGLAAE